MQIRRVFSLILFLTIFTGYAQSPKTHRADKLFDQFMYQNALKEYHRLLKTDPKDKAYIIQKLGDAYNITGDSENAEIWYAQAVSQKNINPSYYYKYAMVLRENKKYKESLEWLKKYKQYNKIGDSRVQEFFNENDIVERIKKDGDKAEIWNIAVNSPYTEYGAVYFKDDQIIYTSNNHKTIGKKVSSWNNLPFTDLYIAKIVGDSIIGNSFVKNGKFSRRINTRYHEESPTFNSDYTVMFFTRNNLRPGRTKKGARDYNLKIYKSFFKKGKWTRPREVHFDSNKYNCAHPSLSKDGKTLYFSSDMPGGYGKSDIYKVAVNDDWTLGEPKNMGKLINTEGRETFPFIDSTGNLFFSSDGHAGLGGLDIFVAFFSKGELFMLRNAGLPYNSSKDDFGFVLHESNDVGLLSSNKPGGKGDDDIYYFKITSPPIKPLILLEGYVKDKSGQILPETEILLYRNQELVDKKTVKEDGKYKFLVDINKDYMIKANKPGYGPTVEKFHTYNPSSAKINKDIILSKITEVAIRGRVVDYATTEPINNVKISVRNVSDNSEKVIYTDPEGRIKIPVPKDKQNIDYELEFRKPGYLPYRIRLKRVADASGTYYVKENDDDVKLIRMDLEPIYFNFDKSNIRRDAAVELGKITKVMKEHKKVELSLESHTDSRGSKKYNLALSERRAKSTFNYLVKRGVEARRMQYRGFGESKLVNHCSDGVKCSRKEHQLNRRTEFIIIKM